jgi:CBS domain-containing protein
VDWLARYARLLDESIVGRVLNLAGVRDEGMCWCFHGASGRGESMTPATPQIVVIAADEATRADAAQASERVEEMLERCGYVARQAKSDQTKACATLGEWEDRFRGWIEDPVLNGISLARPYFDLLPVLGARELWGRLEKSVTARLRAEPGFTILLANDCLANLPPLTFFRDLVVEESGEQTGIFRLERSALMPLVDVARVFGVACGKVLGSSSGERFAMASRLVPEQEALFREAAETLRVVLFHQARAGIRQNSEGYDLPAAQLSAQERLVLKCGFRSIVRLLEFTAEFGWQEIA